MPQRRHIVLIETARGRTPARFHRARYGRSVDVAMKVPERGLEPYRVRFDPRLVAWVVTVIDWIG